MFPQKGGSCITVNRWRKDIPLSQHATDGAKLPDLFLSLDPLSDDTNVHLLCDANKALDDRQADPIGLEMVNEHLVDFDDIDGNRQKVRQRRETRSEVVECDTYALSAQCPDL